MRARSKVAALLRLRLCDGVPIRTRFLHRNRRFQHLEGDPALVAPPEILILCMTLY
jgi:hypothetical protein